jgi:hypothetical protein
MAVRVSTRRRLMNALDVSADELDALVGADPAKAATVETIVTLLEVKLKPDRIREVVRRPAPVFGGQTMLDAIRSGEHVRVLAVTRASFEWDRPA